MGPKVLPAGLRGLALQAKEQHLITPQQYDRMVDGRVSAVDRTAAKQALAAAKGESALKLATSLLKEVRSQLQGQPAFLTWRENQKDGATTADLIDHCDRVETHLHHVSLGGSMADIGEQVKLKALLEKK